MKVILNKLINKIRMENQMKEIDFFSKEFMKKLLCFLIIIFCCICILNIFKGFKSIENKTNFEECSFKELCSYSKEYPNKRKYIVEPLIKKSEFKNLTKSQVVSILGKPSKESSEKCNITYAYEKKDFVILEYTLFINIDFDKNNKVVRADTFVIDH